MTAEILSSKFSGIIRSWLSEEQIADINKKNETPEYFGCCATHDYCDANEAMADAYMELFNTLDLTDTAMALMNAAWNISKESKFKNN